jgi:hypothetical protein
MLSSPDAIVGPYERWAYGPGARYVRPAAAASPYLAAVAELPAGAGQDTLARAVGDAARLLVPTLWTGDGGVEEPAILPFVLALPEAGRSGPGPLETMARIAGLAAPARPIGFRANGPLPAATVDEGFSPDALAAREPADGARAPAAVVAVIDDGIAFAHRNLRCADGRSRVAYCWLQGEAIAPEPGDRTVLFGREYDARDIDALVLACGGDEDVVYNQAVTERAGRVTRAPVHGLATHGAHVLDLAAGHRHGAPGGSLDDVAVIAVELPLPVTLDTAGLGKDAFVLAALHYVFDRADRLAARHGLAGGLPLVVNFSYGFTGGPHGGRDLLERALRDLVRRRARLGAPTHLVMPSGNTFHDRLHGRITPALVGDDPARGYAIPWRIQPADRTPNYLEIWLPAGAVPDGLAVAVIDPAGERLHEARIGPARLMHAELGAGPIGQLSLERFATGGDEALWRIVVALAPTQPDDPRAPGARAGLWRIELGGLGPVLAAGPIACRIQRDISPFGHAIGARQSYFDDPRHSTRDPTGRLPSGPDPEDAFVRRFGTLNGLATHDAVTVVGGVVARTGEPAAYGACGDVADETSRIHLSAASEALSALPGIASAGTRSGATARMTGTSTAAPQVCRALAASYLERGVEAEPDGSPAQALARLGDRLEPVGADAGPARRARLGDGLLRSRP